VFRPISSLFILEWELEDAYALRKRNWDSGLAEMNTNSRTDGSSALDVSQPYSCKSDSGVAESSIVDVNRSSRKDASSQQGPSQPPKHKMVPDLARPVDQPSCRPGTRVMDCCIVPLCSLKHVNKYYRSGTDAGHSPGGGTSLHCQCQCQKHLYVAPYVGGAGGRRNVRLSRMQQRTVLHEVMS